VHSGRKKKGHDEGTRRIGEKGFQEEGGRGRSLLLALPASGENCTEHIAKKYKIRNKKPANLKKRISERGRKKKRPRIFFDEGTEGRRCQRYAG